jgi:hypothetical protein
MMVVPKFEEPGLTRFLEDMAKEVQLFRTETMNTVRANHSLLLMSPSKKVYEIKVDDAGVLSATLVMG